MSEQIQQMQRLQLAGTLAGGIAHDLNNELTLILGHLDLALGRLTDGSDLCASLEHARSAAGRCAGMSRHLVSVGGRRRTVTTKMDVAASVSEAHQMLEYVKPPRTRILTETETGLFIRGDASHIQQAVVTLGNNSFQAMDHGGELSIRAFRDEGLVHISVHDTGCGILPSLQPRIFEPFFTHREAGDGFGLASVHFIVKRHGGTIELDSSADQGTTFRLSFPPWQPEAEER